MSDKEKRVLTLFSLLTKIGIYSQEVFTRECGIKKVNIKKRGGIIYNSIYDHICYYICVPSMGNNLVVKVHYGLGSRNR